MSEKAQKTLSSLQTKKEDDNKQSNNDNFQTKNLINDIIEELKRQEKVN